MLFNYFILCKVAILCLMLDSQVWCFMYYVWKPNLVISRKLVGEEIWSLLKWCIFILCNLIKLFWLVIILEVYWLIICIYFFFCIGFFLNKYLAFVLNFHFILNHRLEGLSILDLEYLLRIFCLCLWCAMPLI